MNLLVATGLDPKTFYLEYPNDLSEIMVERLAKNAGNAGLQNRIRKATTAMANETTDEARTGAVRLRFKWAHSKKPFDDLIVFFCAFLVSAS